MTASQQQEHALLSFEDISDRLEKVIADSPADETEIVWLEGREGEARRHRGKAEARSGPRRSISVRVLDRGRVGSYRTGSAEAGDLADAVRCAMAQSRVRAPLSGLPHLPKDDEELAGPAKLFDPEIGNLTARKAKSLLMSLKAKQESLSFTWADARVAVFSSRDVRRMARVSAAGLDVRTGRQPGSGRAADAGRRLKDIQPQAILERARERRAAGELEDLPRGPVPAVLAPGAVIELCDMLNQTSFSAKAYYDGTSFLREHINIQVFDRRLHLKDDGTDASGIPFPFDLEGTAKRPVDLILKGAPKTPTLDQRQAAVLGLPPTAHAIGGDNARAENLFLVCGGDSEEEMVRAAGDGIWITWLDHLECFEPRRVRFRARARGVRLIRDGRLGPPLPDFMWEDSLLRAFSNLAGIGQRASRRLSHDGYLGGVTAPAVALASIEAAPEEASPPAADSDGSTA